MTKKRLCCFICGKWFEPEINDSRCGKCGWQKCPHCGGCYCTLNIGEKRVADAMWRTYSYDST